jgi:N-acetylmuramoyl-L-alanine amidase
VTSDDASGALWTRRRPLLRGTAAAVIGAGVITGTGAGVLRALNSGDGRRGGRLELRADKTSGVGLLERSLRDLGLVATGPGEWITPQLETSLVTMVGLTWRDGVRPPRIYVRFRIKGGWTLWRAAPVLHDLPDRGSGEGVGKIGTVPVTVEESDGIQVRVAGSVPPELSLTLIHADRLAGDERLAAGTTSRSALRTSAAVATPTVCTRAQWGADESWRDGAPRYNSTILQAHVHHTATSNGYAQADVPAMIRSMYRYHTHSLGWSDIAYNFLIDSYGTIWEGRYGGIDQPVRGAHTLGFNNSSTGFSMIGNYESAQPSSAMLGSLANLAAWKLAMYGCDPQGWTQVESEGSDKFPSGKIVSLPVIDGHRDTNDTACPGGNVYAQLGNLRAATAAVIAASTLKLKKPFRVSGDAWLAGTLTAFHGKFKPKDAAVSYQWTRNGVAIDGGVATSYVVTEADVAQILGVVVTGSVPGAPPISQTVNLPEPCRSVPVCSVRTQRKRGGKVIVHFDVSAPGVVEPDGTVVIKVGDRERTVKVKKGKAIARIVGMPPGRYRVRCQYAGGTYVLQGKARDWVRVPGKGHFAKG